MAGRAHEGGAVVELAGGDLEREIDGGAGGQKRRRPGAVRVEGVGVEPAGAALADGALERIEVCGRVRELELGACRRARSDAHTARRQPRGGERGVDRGHALGTLRVLARGAMRQEALVGDQPCSHARHSSIRCRVAMWPRALAAVAVAVAYLAMAPRVVNGDGLGYVKAALAGALYPGHLAYVPLLGVVARVAGVARPAELVWPARVWSAIAAALAAWLVGDLARRRHGSEAAAWAAMLGMAASWGTLSAGSDVESYAPALGALVGALWLADRQWPVAAGLACAAATLLHIENLLFVPVCALVVADRRARLIVVATAGAAIATAYAIVLPAHGVAWLAGASHGLHYPLRWSTPFVAVYGACKALVYSPYPYEASWTRVGVAFAVGAAAAIALATCMRRPLPRAATLAWIAPYALVGVAFWSSDAERWTFLLPLAWLAAAARPRRALAVAAAIFAANVILWLPTARDATLRARAVAAARHLHPGDAVVGPGHGWDEYVGFYDTSGARPFPLVYFAGALGPGALPSALADAARGHRLFVARFADDGDPMGWKELRRFGIDRSNVRTLLPPGHAAPIGDGLDEWTP